MKASRPEPEWDRGRRKGRWGVAGESDKGERVCVWRGYRGPPAVPASAEAAVKRGPVFFPRPARRETLPQLARVKSHR